MGRHGKYSAEVRERAVRLVAGVERSVGSVGESYDNALAETVLGLYKTGVVRPPGPWSNIDAVDYATLDWVDWFSRRRLLEPLGSPGDPSHGAGLQ